MKKILLFSLFLLGGTMKPTNCLRQITLPELMKLWHIYDKLSEKHPKYKERYFLIRDEIDKRIFFGENDGTD